MRHAHSRLLLVSLAIAVFAACPLDHLGAQGHRNFEVGQTRPLAVSADGLRLFCVDTPGDRLLVWSLQEPARPFLIASIPVGARPVAVTERKPDEVWVANRLGDSVSVVSLAERRVVEELAVGDEVSDVVFARGDRKQELAFVAVALEHRVAVFDAETRAPLASIDIFGDQLRALAVRPDGRRVYGIVHRSGNGTTIIPETDPRRPAPPKQGPGLSLPPRAGTIVDASDPFWGPRLGVRLPDEDLFEIDTAALRVTRTWSGLGTLHFALAVDPKGRVWTANTDARNRVRHDPALRGHVVDHRLTRVDPAASKSAATRVFDLNPGIDYSVLPNPAALATSLAQVTDVVAAPDGSLWCSAFGSDRVAQVAADGRVIRRIEVGSTAGARVAPLEKRGPRGLALHPRAGLLYVYARLSHSILVFDRARGRRLLELPLPLDPTPDDVRRGRAFLYDAKLSGNGTASCSSCHTDGGIDGLVWDLGDPRGRPVRIRMAEGALSSLHPMKGPLATQTLKGIRGAEPFHWRGDRRRFADFNPTFDDLLGGRKLSASELDLFTRFVFSIEHMPNPSQLRDRSYARVPAGESAEDGRRFFFDTVVFKSFRCFSCHVNDDGSGSLIFHDSTLQTEQPLKIPQLRTSYRRLGRSRRRGQDERASGFGLAHDGATDTVFDFLSRPVFEALSKDAKKKRMLERFLLAFDTGTAPAVGWSKLADARNATSAALVSYLTVMAAQAAAGHIDLVARGRVLGRETAFLWRPTTLRFEASTGAAWARAELLAILAKNAGYWLLFDGVAPGGGARFALDRDANGRSDGLEAPRPFGRSTPPCASIDLAAVGRPLRGSADFGLVLRGARGAALFVVSSAKLQTRAFGIEIFVDPSAAVALWKDVDARGLAYQALPIPARAELRGRVVFAQAITVADCASGGVAGSEAIEIRVR